MSSPCPPRWWWRLLAHGRRRGFKSPEAPHAVRTACEEGGAATATSALRTFARGRGKAHVRPSVLSTTRKRMFGRPLRGCDGLLGTGGAAPDITPALPRISSRKAIDAGDKPQPCARRRFCNGYPWCLCTCAVCNPCG